MDENLDFSFISNIKKIYRIDDPQRYGIDEYGIEQYYYPEKYGIEYDMRGSDLVALTLRGFDFKKVSDIPGITKLHKLRSLKLSDNKLEEFEGLENFSELKGLDLAGNQVSEIINLKTLKKLEFLDLSYNNIKEIDELKTLEN